MRKAKNSMKEQLRIKKTMVVAALMMVLALTMHPVEVRSQIFLTDEDMETNLRDPKQGFVVPVPYQGGDADEYLPLGNGVLVLTALGGAYLLSKRKKSKH